MPKAPVVPAIPERQAMKLPDDGFTAGRSDDIAKRRRGMMATVMTGPAGLGTSAQTTATTKLGG